MIDNTDPPRCLLAVNGDVAYLAAEKVTQLRSSEARKDPILAPAFTAGIYILHNPHTDLVKIGYSDRDMVSRWRNIELSSGMRLAPFMLWAVSGPREIEQCLHERFSEHRELGEWFQTVPVATWISDFRVTAAWLSRPASELPKPVRRALGKGTEADHAELVEELLGILWHKLRDIGPRSASAQAGWFSRTRAKRLKDVRPLGQERGLLERDPDTLLWYALDPNTGERLAPPLLGPGMEAMLNQMQANQPQNVQTQNGTPQ